MDSGSRSRGDVDPGLGRSVPSEDSYHGRRLGGWELRTSVVPRSWRAAARLAGVGLVLGLMLLPVAGSSSTGPHLAGSAPFSTEGTHFRHVYCNISSVKGINSTHLRGTVVIAENCNFAQRRPFTSAT